MQSCEPMTNANILIILADDSDVADLEERLKNLGHAVCGTLSCGRQAIEKAPALHPDLALIDLALEGEVNGIEVAEQLGREVPVVYLTDGADADLLQRAQETQPFGYVLKPIDERQLHLSIQTALSLYAREREHLHSKSELERTVGELQQQKQLMETILESIREGVIAIDENGKYLAFNSSAKRMFGDPEPGLSLEQRSQAYGLFLPDRVTLFPAADLPLTRAAVAGESADDVEIFIRNAEIPEGVFVSVNARPIHRAGDWGRGGVLTCRDITKYKEREADLEQVANELSEQAQLFEAVVNNVNDGVILADLTDHILFINTPARRMLGIGIDEEILDIPLSERSEKYGIFQPDRESYVPAEQLPLVNAVRGEDRAEVEFFVRNESHAAGMHVGIRGHVLRHNPSRRVKAGMAIIRELTKEKALEKHLIQSTDMAQPSEPVADVVKIAAYEEMEGRLEQTINELRDQTQLLEAICDNIGDGIIVVDPIGQIVFANVTTERIFGTWIVDPEFSDWSKVFGIFYPDIKTHVPVEKLPITRAMMGEETDEMELFIHNQKNPTGTYVSTHCRPIFNSDKTEVVAALAILRDLTEEKEAEARLAQTTDDLHNQTQLMETVFDSMSEGIVVVGTTGHVILANPSVQRIFNMHTMEIDPDKWSETYGIFYSDKETYVPTDQLPLANALLNGEATGEQDFFVRNAHNAAGSYVSASAYPLLGSEGEVVAAIGIIRDITKRKMAEDQLEQTIDKLRDQTQLMETIFNSISDGVIVADEEGKFNMFNPSAEQIVGIGMLDIPPEEWTELYGVFYSDKKTHVPTDQLPLVRSMNGEEIDDIELFIRNEQKPDGVHISVSGRPLMKEGKEQNGGVVAFRDVTQRKMAENALQETIDELRNQNELMEATFNSINDGIIVADSTGKFLYINPGAKQILGNDTSRYEGAWTTKPGTFFHTDRETPIANEDLPLPRAILKGESTDDEDIFIRNAERPDGFCIRVSGRPLLAETGEVRRGVLTFRDVTEQLVAEEALTQAFAQGRLEIVDTILHNIGNAINSVTIGIETVHRNLMDDSLMRRLSITADAIERHREDWSDYIQNDPQGQKLLPFVVALAKDFSQQRITWLNTIDRVKGRANHIADIVRTQKALSSPSMVRKDINLQDAITSATRILQESLNSRDIKLTVHCENAPQEIRIQESQFHQMLVNLIRNSIEAIDDLASAGGLEETPCIQIHAYSKGDFLYLDMCDNGIGIDIKDAKRLFAAGYTTKKTGSGLGLHSAANFVIGSGGKIRPLSDGIGQGTTMQVMLRLEAIAPAQDIQDIDTPQNP